jgi:hypothetical protein
MTPCRVVDTRVGQGFTGAFGPPSLVGGMKRTFPIQSNTNCSIPSIAQAYSFNVTVVPFGFLDFLTVAPTPLSLPPTFSTLNGYVNTVIANAAIVPAGTSGSVDVYASHNTELIIDINGYYAAQSGITLAKGTAGAPSLSFSGDPGTGIFSDVTGAVNIVGSGISRLRVTSNGNMDVAGNLAVSGKVSSASVGVGTNFPQTTVDVRGWLTLDPGGDPALFTSSGGIEQNRYLSIFNSPSFTSASGVKAGGVLVADDFGYANPGKNDLIVKGKVGIGTNAPTAKLRVSGAGVFNAPEAARFDLFNTTAGTGFLQHVTDSGLLQFATTGGATRMVIDPSGNLGLGTATPQAKLQIGGAGTNGYALGVVGNVTQNLENFGFPKAMLLVNETGSIARCFNSTIAGIGATAIPCGFIVGLFNAGSPDTDYYQVNFGFRVIDRFISITPGVPVSTRNVAGQYYTNTGNENVLNVLLELTDQQLKTTTGPFTLIVY